MFYVTSIPLTGTRFILDLLRTVHFHHVYSPHVRVLSSDIVIAPLRHPISVWASWCQRRQDYEFFLKCWGILNEFAKAKDILFLPVDHQDRSIYLERISEKIGKPLHTDWHPVGHEPPTRPVVDADLSEVLSYPFVREIYD